MQSFALLTLAAAALVQAAPAAPGHVDVVTGTAYTATFEEADASQLQQIPGVINTNITYQGLNVSQVGLAIQKPPGTATTFFLIPSSPDQYGQIAPGYVEYANFTRDYLPPNGVIRSAKKNQKLQLGDFFFGCSAPQGAAGYFNVPVNCTLAVTGYGGSGGSSQTIYADFAPVTGDCAQLGSTTLHGPGCARLAYVDGGEELSYYGPFSSISFSLPSYVNDNANTTSIFLDDISYTTHIVAS